MDDRQIHDSVKRIECRPAIEDASIGILLGEIELRSGNFQEASLQFERAIYALSRAREVLSRPGHTEPPASA